jgi:hypothetical protein
VLVDTYAALAPLKETLIGSDGLHTTPAGNLVIAEAFLAAITATYEVPPPTASPVPAALSPRVPGSRTPRR